MLYLDLLISWQSLALLTCRFVILNCALSLNVIILLSSFLIRGYLDKAATVLALIRALGPP